MFESVNINTERIIIGAFVISLLIVPATGIAVSLTDEGSRDDINREEILESSENETTVVVFYSDNCKYCDKTLDYVSDEVENHDNVSLKSYKVGDDGINETLYHKSIESGHTGVPAVQVGNDTWFGYTESLEDNVRDKIKDCNSNGCGIPDVHKRR